MATPMNIALVGIGKIALDAHVPAISSSPDWSLAATVSRNNTIADIEAYTDLDTLLDKRPDITTLSLCMPPRPRFAYARTALMAGRHVMLEKPPGATLSEVHALEKLAQDNKVSIYATWHSREAAMVPAAKAWLATRTLRSARMVWKEDVRHFHPGQDWVWDPGSMGMFDMGINGLSILTEIIAEPMHLKSAQLDVPENKQMPIAGTLAFYHPGGAEVRAEMDWDQKGPATWAIHVETDAGELRLSKGGAQMHINGDRVSLEPSSAPTGEYPRLYQKMAALVRAGRSDVDLTPMRHVADAFALAHRRTVAPFLD